MTAEIGSHRQPDWPVIPIITPALCFFFLSAIAASGQPLTGCCELRIEVRGAGQEPLAGANVDVSGPGRTLSDRTGSNGNAVFTLPRPGTYTVSASKDGYIRLSRELEVTIGDRITVEFVLLPHLVEAQTRHGNGRRRSRFRHPAIRPWAGKSGLRRNVRLRSETLSLSSPEWFARSRASL